MNFNSIHYMIRQLLIKNLCEYAVGCSHKLGYFSWKFMLSLTAIFLQLIPPYRSDVFTTDCFV